MAHPVLRLAIAALCAAGAPAIADGLDGLANPAHGAGTDAGQTLDGLQERARSIAHSALGLTTHANNPAQQAAAPAPAVSEPAASARGPSTSGPATPYSARQLASDALGLTMEGSAAVVPTAPTTAVATVATVAATTPSKNNRQAEDRSPHHALVSQTTVSVLEVLVLQPLPPGRSTVTAQLLAHREELFWYPAKAARAAPIPDPAAAQPAALRQADQSEVDADGYAGPAQPPLPPAPPMSPDAPLPLPLLTAPALVQREPGVATARGPQTSLVDDKPPEPPLHLGSALEMIDDALFEPAVEVADVTASKPHVAVTDAPAFERAVKESGVPAPDRAAQVGDAPSFRRDVVAGDALALAPDQEVASIPSFDAGFETATGAGQMVKQTRTSLIVKAMEELEHARDATGLADRSATAALPEDGRAQVDIFAVAQPAVERVGWIAELSNVAKAVQFGEKTLLAASPSKLDALRGGFDPGNGLRVSFGITRVAYINGNLATTNSLQIADVGKLSADQAALLNNQLKGMNLIQNGPNNQFLASQNTGAVPGTVIQNSLDNQNIRTRTVIDASANSAGMLRNVNLQRTLSEAIGGAMRK